MQMLSAAAITFSTVPKLKSATLNLTKAKAGKVVGPLKTTVTLLQEDSLRVCLVATPFITDEEGAYVVLQQQVSKALKIPIKNVVVFSSHDHCVPTLTAGPAWTWTRPLGRKVKVKLLDLGKQFVKQLVEAAMQLPDHLEPVSVWYAVGKEDRITYNRKGRRADGSTYLMREEDRRLLGKDFCGHIDTDAPVVCLKNAKGKPVSFLVQYTGHPVTAYHPERPIVYGEWPQVACEELSRRHSNVPVSFLQGCAGDINSKEMFFGGVKRSQQFGHYLGQAYLQAVKGLKTSKRQGMNFEVIRVQVPLQRLPSRKMVEQEIDEIKDFIRRAKSGDENTLSCVGLNFPRSLSPAYRAALVKMILPWSRRTLSLHKQGKADRSPKYVEMEVNVLRLGDVGIVGLPGEPFSGIGRLIKKNSPLPLAIPCGYTNFSFGYITDSPNTGDREYMSSFYRYTKYRPPYRKPAGDVLARQAVKTLKQFAKGN
jgi:hypothetical protein